VPEQLVVPGTQTQAAELHIWFTAHTLLQPPQLPVSFRRSVQFGPPLQMISPVPWQRITHVHWYGPVDTATWPAEQVRGSGETEFASWLFQDVRQSVPRQNELGGA
jgi:hypothetical protein